MDRGRVSAGSGRAHGTGGLGTDGDVVTRALGADTASDDDVDAPSRRRWRALAQVAVVLLLALGLGVTAAVVLGDGEDSAPTRPTSTLLGANRLTSALPRSGALPPPTGPVVLTIANAPRPNVGTALRLDMGLLESLGTWSLTVDDRQATGRTVEFTGPLLRDVLDAAGIARGTLNTVAINDYRVDIPVADAFELPVLLATRADGKRMSVADYGPTRIVYPTEDYDLDPTVYEPRWIWQLASMSAS